MVTTYQRSLRWGLIVAVACLALAGCDEKLSDITGPTPNLRPTLSSIQAEVFTPRCAGCHTNVGRNPPMGLNLTEGNSFANLVGVGARGKAGETRVIPGDPDGSYLVHKLEGRPGISGLRMPFQNNPLTDGQIRVIRRWIEIGAPND